MTDKFCICCENTLPIKDFTLDKNRKDELSPYCRKCTNQKHKEHYDINKDEIKARYVIKYKKMKQDRLQNMSKDERKEFIRRRMYTAAKCRAKKTNLEFNIDISDISIPEKCPILKLPFEFHNKITNRRTSPSLDRIDSSKGYIKGNVQVISWLANSIKNDATKEELLLFATWVFNFYTN